MPAFLTALPKDEQVTGSRDPLGFLPLWSELGRRAIANVTTVSADMQGWITLAVATLETRELIGDDEEAFLPTFLMVEQLVAYARCLNTPDRSVRGANEVRKRLRRDLRQRLGSSSDRQILINQETTGVWGQVSRPARRSGLLDEHLDRLTDEAHTEVASLADDHLGVALRRRLRACVRARTIDLEAESPLVEALQRLHQVRPVGHRQHLLQRWVLNAGADRVETLEPAPAQSAPPLQAELVNLLRIGGFDPESPFTSTGELRDRATREGNRELADWLLQILQLEKLLGPLEHLFRYVLVPRDRTIAQLAEEVGDALGPLSLDTDPALEVAASLSKKGAGFDCVEAAHEAIQRRDWARLIGTVVDRNKAIMGARKRGAWIRRAPGDRLEIDLGAPDDGFSPSLPEDLQAWWAHGYYLPELSRLVWDIEGPPDA